MANEAEAYAYGTKGATVEQVAVKAHARKRQSGNVLEIVHEGTPTEVVEHRLSEAERTCAVCGATMEEIGKEVHRSLKMKPAQFWIQEDVYYTYACKKCEQETGEGNLLKTPKQPALYPGSFASPEAVAHIMVQKFGDAHAAIPSGTGVPPAGPAAVPADDGQLDPACLRYLAAAYL